MFPSKSRDARADNGAAPEVSIPAEGSPPPTDDRMSHLQPTYQAHLPAGQTSGRAPVGEDPGALLIGGGVELKGRIGSCDALVVEGTVESTIECRSIEIRASGTVSGEATVETATVMGRFDGDLVVNGCLTLHASGRISGSVRYGEIEIERGGHITGDIGAVGSEVPAIAPAAIAPAAIERPASPDDRAAEELAARVESI